MNLNFFKIFFVFVGSSLASVITYYSLDYLLDVDLNFIEYSIFKNDENLEVNLNGNTNNLIKFVITRASGQWECHLNGRYAGHLDDIDKAQKDLKAELEDLIVSGKNKRNNKLGLLKSCARNRKNPNSESLNILISSEIFIEIEKIGEKWKFKEEDKKELLNGKISENIKKR